MFYLICALLFLVQLQPAPVLSAHPKGMYFPVMFTTPNPPPYICYHFRKLCYVPGVSSGWRGWYRKGFSGYFIHNSWMYYMNKVGCPCVFPMPPNPNGEETTSILEKQHESGI